MLTIDSAKLDQRVAITNRTVTTDAYGQETDTYATTETVWAEVRPIRGTELFESQQTYHGVSHKVTMRYTTSVTATSVLTLEDATSLKVLGIIRPDLRGDKLELACLVMT